jgi:hypothetical protein
MGPVSTYRVNQTQQKRYVDQGEGRGEGELTRREEVRKDWGVSRGE